MCLNLELYLFLLGDLPELTQGVTLRLPNIGKWGTLLDRLLHVFVTGVQPVTWCSKLLLTNAIISLIYSFIISKHLIYIRVKKGRTLDGTFTGHNACILYIHTQSYILIHPFSVYGQYIFYIIN